MIHIQFHSFHLIDSAILLYMAPGFGPLVLVMHTEEVVTCKCNDTLENTNMSEKRKATRYLAVGVRLQCLTIC